MASRNSRTRHNRRDRRLAKASGFSREGTVNPKKVAHHSYGASGVRTGRIKPAQPAPKSPTNVVYDDGPPPNRIVWPDVS